MEGINDRQVSALERISGTWPIDTIRAYMDNNTQLADELSAEGLDSTQALAAAPVRMGGAVLVRRYQQGGM